VFSRIKNKLRIKALKVNRRWAAKGIDVTSCGRARAWEAGYGGGWVLDCGKALKMVRRTPLKSCAPQKAAQRRRDKGREEEKGERPENKRGFGYAMGKKARPRRAIGFLADGFSMLLVARPACDHAARSGPAC
jgi:hypothetical protein